MIANEISRLFSETNRLCIEKNRVLFWENFLRFLSQIIIKSFGYIIQFCVSVIKYLFLYFSLLSHGSGEIFLKDMLLCVNST